MDRKLLRIRGTFAGLVLLALVAIPLPYRVKAPGVIELQEAASVYVSLPGRLVEAVPAGASVRKGQVLARLKNTDIRLDVEKLEGQQHQLERQADDLDRQRVSDPAAATLLPTIKERLADVTQRLEQRRADQARLILLAPTAGTVIPPPRRFQTAAAGELSDWSGTPLEEHNRGCYLETGTLLCQIGDPRRLRAVLVVDQADIEFVQTDQDVCIQLNELPGVVRRGTVTEIAKVDLKPVSQDLLANADLPKRVDRTGLARPAGTTYQARVTLDEQDDRILIGAPGRAKICVPSQSLAQRVYRFVSRTFRFEL